MEWKRARSGRWSVTPPPLHLDATSLKIIRPKPLTRVTSSTMRMGEGNNTPYLN